MSDPRIVNLDRTFASWNAKDEYRLDQISIFGSTLGSLKWSKLLENRRVVVLAEAGCGKTTEFKSKRDQLESEGAFAFYATVQDVGKDGLKDALGITQWNKFLEWQKSDKRGYFFIDSIDEAKLDNVKFATALRKLADGLESTKTRAHVVISGRISDWEKISDLKSFSEFLNVPEMTSQPKGFSPEEKLISILNHEHRRSDKKEEKEKPLIVVMAPLNQERVKLYAAAKNVESVDNFIAAIDAANLWMFARRPADLDWLIGYWRKYNRFGLFAEMLEFSLKERLKEPKRARGDEISEERAMLALERIGAALVFGRIDKLTIPDPEASDTENREAELTKILSDWTPDHITRLRSRAVFDPASFGTIRLHGDNEGTVRAFLAARWLQKRSKQSDFTKQDIRDLLFASTYGNPLVIQSVKETAAWLAINDPDVANELVKRNPFVLLFGGDPASLGASIRMDALREAVRRIAKNGDRHMWDNDSLRRFSTPDLLPEIKSLWKIHKNNKDVRALLTQMLALGKLSGADEIIEEAAFSDRMGSLTATFGGRALMAVSSPAMRKRYAGRVITKAGEMPDTAVWEALEEMFTQEIDVTGFFSVIDALKVGEEKNSYGLSHRGAGIVSKAKSKSDLEALLKGMLKRLGKSEEWKNHEETPEEEAFRPAIAAVATKLISLSGQNEIPAGVADAAFRLGERQRFRTGHEDQLAFRADLRSTATRRRKMLYAAKKYFKAAPIMRGQPLNSVHQLDFLGWSPGLRVEDVDWLLKDVAGAKTNDDKVFFIGAALTIWRDFGKDSSLLARISVVAKKYEATKEQVKAWTEPQFSLVERESLRDIEKVRKKAKLQRDKRDESWRKFLKELRNNPQLLREFKPKKKGYYDARLFHLWQILSASENHQSRYAIESVEPLRDILGDKLTEEFRIALIKFWRTKQPILVSDRPEDKKNQINSLDCMGIASVSLEAKNDPQWAQRLSSNEAKIAAKYATLELNGFPFWLSDLITAHPEEVSSVLMGEVKANLASTKPTPHGILQDIVYSPPFVAEAVADDLFKEIKKRNDLPYEIIERVLNVISTGLKKDREEFATFCLKRFENDLSPSIAGIYLTSAFTVDPNSAVIALAKKLDKSDLVYQKPLAECLLPNLFGDGIMRRRTVRPTLPLDVLSKLVTIAFRTVRVEEDNVRESGKVYSPNSRDNAERARSYAFEQLLSVPGYPTYALLETWAKDSTLSIPAERLHELAFTRAAQDAEHTPWRLSEAYDLEQKFDVAPSSTDDLQRCAIRRLSDIQLDLHGADFAQGKTLKRLPNEDEVQNWVAAQLKSMEKRAYSVERESVVVEGKAPDIRLRAKISNASLPVEIKVAEANTLEKLQDALKVQLAGRYLRDRTAKCGVLLLVHQKARPQGWVGFDGKMIRFDQVIKCLKNSAREMGTPPDAPQTAIAVIDVSNISIKGKKKAKKKKIKSSTKNRVAVTVRVMRRTAPKKKEKRA